MKQFIIIILINLLGYSKTVLSNVPQRITNNSRTFTIVRPNEEPLPVSFTAQWRCEEAQNVANVPTTLDINLDLVLGNRGPTRVFRNPQLESLLESARQANINLSDCLRTLYLQMGGAISEACIQAQESNNETPTQSHRCSIMANLANYRNFASINDTADDLDQTHYFPATFPYHELPTPISANKEGAMRRLASNMIENCGISGGSYRVANSAFMRDRYLRMSKNFIQDYLRPRMEDLEPNCQHAIMADIVRDFSYNLPGNCESTPERIGAPATCSQIHENIRLFFAEMGNFLPNFPNNDLQFICSAFENEQIDIRDLLNFSQVIRTINNCTPLQTGESRVVNSSNLGAGVNATYRVRKLRENHIETTLNVRFNPPSAHEDKMREARGCIQEAAPYLRTPSGKRMNLRLISQAAGPSVPNQRQINIVEATPNLRSNSGNWASNANCSTIIHELLHLAGLVDDYHEPDDAPIYSQVFHGGNQISIPVNPSRRRRQYDCRILAGSPAGTRIRSAPNTIMSNSNNAIPKAARGEMTLISDEQFNMIESGGCFSRSRVYIECSRRAYETTLVGGGNGCSPVPSYCNSAQARRREQQLIDTRWTR